MTAHQLRQRIGGKVTVIDLHSHGAQQDTMLTHYFVTGRQGATDHHSIVALLQTKKQEIEQLGVRVLRTKLEYSYSSFSELRLQLPALVHHGLYAEAHIKVNLGELSLSDLATSLMNRWALSLNPDNNGAQFINLRITKQSTPRFISTLNQRVNLQVCRLPPGLKVERIQTEVALVDDAPEHDEWWAA